MGDRQLPPNWGIVCFGKEGFPSAHKAMTSAGKTRLRSKDRLPISAYYCPKCGAYHWGHTPKRLR